MVDKHRLIFLGVDITDPLNLFWPTFRLSTPMPPPPFPSSGQNLKMTFYYFLSKFWPNLHFFSLYTGKKALYWLFTIKYLAVPTYNGNAL